MASDFTVAWSLNGTPITRYDSAQKLATEVKRQTVSADRFGTATYLEIPNVELHDAGIYTCVRVVREDMVPIISKNVTLNVQGGIELTINSDVDVGGSIVAECCFESTLSLENEPFDWYSSPKVKGYNDFSENQNFKDLDMTYCRSITIPNDLSFHEVSLVCLVPKELRISCKKTIYINHPASVELSNVANIQNRVIVEKNQVVNVTCLSEGYPAPYVVLQKHIQKNNEWVMLPNDEPLEDLNERSVWTFSYNITNETSCLLRCYADNGIGSTSTSDIVMVEVEDADNITVSIKVNAENDKYNHKTCDVTCMVIGNPWLKVFLQIRTAEGQWTTYSDQHFLRERRDGEFIWKFQVKGIQQSSDEYRCVAYNTEFYVYSQPSKFGEVLCDPVQNRAKQVNIQFVVIACITALILVTGVLMYVYKLNKTAHHQLFVKSKRFRDPTIATNPSYEYSNQRNIPDVCNCESNDNPPTARVQEEKQQDYENLPVTGSNNKDRRQAFKGATVEDDSKYAVVNKNRVQVSGTTEEESPEYENNICIGGPNYATVSKKK